MTRTIAIHGTNGFAPRWLETLPAMGFAVRRVDLRRGPVREQLAGCEALLWNVNHDDRFDREFARVILDGVERTGVRVYPDARTLWSFDDKVAQAHQFAALGLPTPKTWVFFDRAEADRFLDDARLPLVFKLRRGAGGANVQLVRDAAHGRRLTRLMFAAGMRNARPVNDLARAVQRSRRPSRDGATVARRLRRIVPALLSRWLAGERERGYVLFQEFVPGNAVTVRATVIGGRVFAYQRENPPGSFRVTDASEKRYFDADSLPRDIADAALRAAEAIGAQSLAMDFLRDAHGGVPLLLEASYTFPPASVAACPGHLLRSGAWAQGGVRPEDLILEDLLGLERGTGAPA